MGRRVTSREMRLNFVLSQRYLTVTIWSGQQNGAFVLSASPFRVRTVLRPDPETRTLTSRQLSSSKVPISWGVDGSEKPSTT